MFRLHERTRLFLCRAVFLVLCLMPTLFLCGAAAHYRSPSYLEARREEWIAVLSDKLGLDVKIGRLSYPLWNAALLEDLILLVPETGEEVVRTRYVEVVLDNGRWQVAAGQPDVNTASLPQLLDLLHYRLLRGQALHLAPLDFEARELTFRSPDAAQTFQNVHGELATIESGKRADVRFEVAGIESSTPLQLTIDRRRTDLGITTSCRLDTSETTLPCGALAPLAPWLQQLGVEATFRGQAALEQSALGAETEISGEFRDVDLDQLISLRIPHHKLTGSANVDFEHLQLRAGRIVEMQGTLQTCGGGTISRSLLLAVQSQLDLDPGNRSPPLAEPLIRYGHLAFSFRLDAEGLSIAGDASPANRGVIMAGAKAGTLLMESERPVMPAAYLLNTLSPRSEILIPATAEAKWLLELLPLPMLSPPEGEATPSAKVRLRKDR